MEESLLAGYSMPGGDLSSFEARYSFCLSRKAGVFGFFFSFSLFLAWKRIFEGFFLSQALFLIFSTALLLLVFSLSFAGFAEGYHLG